MNQIKDIAGNPAVSLTSASVTNTTPDTTAPTVAYVTSGHADGAFTIGEVISIEVVFSEIVTVTGFPQITLETGTTDTIVTYSA